MTDLYLADDAWEGWLALVQAAAASGEDEQEAEEGGCADQSVAVAQHGGQSLKQIDSNIASHSDVLVPVADVQMAADHHAQQSAEYCPVL